MSRNIVLNNDYKFFDKSIQKFKKGNILSSSDDDSQRKSMIEQDLEISQTNFKNDKYFTSHFQSKIDENLKEVYCQRFQLCEENIDKIHQEKTRLADIDRNHTDNLEEKTVFNKWQLIPVNNWPNQYDQNEGNKERFNAQQSANDPSRVNQSIHNPPSRSNVSSGDGNDDRDGNDDEDRRTLFRSLSRTEFENVVHSYVKKFMEMLKRNVKESQIYRNIETAFNKPYQDNNTQINEIKDVVNNGLKELIYSSKPLRYQNDLLHQIFMFILIHSEEHSQNINCNVPFCRHLWEIYCKIVLSIGSTDIVTQSEAFQVLYSNTNMINHQIAGDTSQVFEEGLDFFIQYTNRIGRGGGGEVFDVAMMLRRGNFRCRQVIKKRNVDAIAVETNENLLSKLWLNRIGEGPNILGPNLVLRSERIYLHLMDRWGVSLQQYIGRLREAHTCNGYSHFQCRSMRNGEFGELVATPLPVFFTLFIQMMKAVQYLHDLDLIHFDIRPANFVLKRGSYLNNIKLIDLDGASGKRIFATNGFAAYEIYQKGVKKTKSVDIFALGTCIPAMLGLTNMILENYDADTLRFRNKIFVDEMQKSGIRSLNYFGLLFSDCTKENMNDRPSIGDMIQHFKSHKLFEGYRRNISEAMQQGNEDVIFKNFDTHPPPGELNHDETNAEKMVTKWIEKKVLDRDLKQKLPSNGSVYQNYQMIQE